MYTRVSKSRFHHRFYTLLINIIFIKLQGRLRKPCELLRKIITAIKDVAMCECVTDGNQ